MILVDTSVLVDYFRTKDKKLLAEMKANGGAVCGVIRAEILQGSRDVRHRRRLIAGLNALAQLPIREDLWDMVGDNLAALRTSEVTVPFADAVIATIAIDEDIELWARDKHF